MLVVQVVVPAVVEEVEVKGTAMRRLVLVLVLVPHLAMCLEMMPMALALVKIMVILIALLLATARLVMETDRGIRRDRTMYSVQLRGRSLSGFDTGKLGYSRTSTYINLHSDNV